MRMWLVNPEKMCRKHLLGEHVEIHMLAGTINKKKSIKGFLGRGLVEPGKAKERHDELVREMERRGYKHNSPLPDFDVSSFSGRYVDSEKSLKDLISRCSECKALSCA